MTVCRSLHQLGDDTLLALRLVSASIAYRTRASPPAAGPEGVAQIERVVGFEPRAPSRPSRSRLRQGRTEPGIPRRSAPPPPCGPRRVRARSIENEARMPRHARCYGRRSDFFRQPCLADAGFAADQDSRPGRSLDARVEGGAEQSHLWAATDERLGVRSCDTHPGRLPGVEGTIEPFERQRADEFIDNRVAGRPVDIVGDKRFSAGSARKKGARRGLRPRR